MLNSTAALASKQEEADAVHASLVSKQGALQAAEARHAAGTARLGELQSMLKEREARLENLEASLHALRAAQDTEVRGSVERAAAAERLRAEAEARHMHEVWGAWVRLYDACTKLGLHRRQSGKPKWMLRSGACSRQRRGCVRHWQPRSRTYKHWRPNTTRCDRCVVAQ